DALLESPLRPHQRRQQRAEEQQPERSDERPAAGAGARGTGGEGQRREAPPESCGAMSVGIAHSGPMTISAKKKPAPRLSVMSVRSRVTNIASRQMKAPRKTPITTSRRARRRSPVRFRMPSLIVPPSRSPPTPAKKTADANSADFRISSWYSFRKNDGSQFK